MSSLTSPAHRRTSGSMAAGWTNVVAAVSPSVPSASWAAAMARSDPTTTAVDSEELGLVEESGRFVLIDLRPVELPEVHLAVGDLEVAGGDRAVTDAGVVQPVERAPATGQQVVADVALLLADPRTHVLGDEDGVAAGVDGGQDQRGDECSLALGEQRHVRLVLDLVTTVDQHVASTGSVERLAPQLHEEPTVPRVAAVHVDVQSAAVGRDRGGDHHAVAHVDARRGGVDADRSQ